MKRHASLTPLSREHHFALRFARQLKGCARAEPEWLKEHWELIRNAAQNYGLSGLEVHFQAEEQGLPWSRLEADWEARLLRDHSDIRDLVARISSGDTPPLPNTLLALALKLDEHVRWEEKELFPAFERSAADAIVLEHHELAIDPRWSLPRPPAKTDGKI